MQHCANHLSPTHNSACTLTSAGRARPQPPQASSALNFSTSTSSALSGTGRLALPAAQQRLLRRTAACAALHDTSVTSSGKSAVPASAAGRPASPAATAGSERRRRRSTAGQRLLPRRRSTACGALQGICFDRACQDAQDQIFLVVIAVPLLCLTAAIAYAVFRKPSDEAAQNIFEDPDTGALFQSTDGATPQRDAEGELMFRPVSYTPWPVEEDFEGERLRIRVGAVGNRQPRTFVFGKRLQQPSAILQATLPRPLGIVFEEDPRRKRVVISEFLGGSPAAKMADSVWRGRVLLICGQQDLKKVKLDRTGAANAPEVGDVLRAVTCTNFVYPTKRGETKGVKPSAQTGFVLPRSLFGIKPPQRTIVLYGADDQRWSQVTTALKRGDRSDGQVTLVLERPLPRDGQ